ncbi:MBL fold metallo-hydrolase [Gryllotalpicola reticulitermitis]|uniref:MBL fold metallo-hydrolase n=1 Tax=Gryllotalpicola reticulitermitis TaxID=1184153 RepID=A0ABV8Q866_9MICO
MTTVPALSEEVTPGVHLVRDTCNVYLVENSGSGERTAIAIDFGSGLALDALAELGIARITHVLMTHHHRDQGQGLPRAVAAGIPIHVPPVEQDLFAAVDEMWAMRALANDYNLRQDRFSILDRVPIAGTVPEYREHDFGGVAVTTIPTPGHTMGSVTYLLDRGGRRIAFSGDLIYAPGKVWSLAATQWSYTENEGPAMSVLSCLLLAAEEPQLLLPSHGEPMTDASNALALLGRRMQAYVDSRRPSPWDLSEMLDDPFVSITEHLLLNWTANSCSYVLLSGTGEALLIDYGYDMSTGWPAGTDRASRRPWLASLPALRRRYGVTRIEVALGTHYHDDHVAGFNLLREVEGTEIWLPEHVADIMAAPLRTDLPCQWFDPIPADRRLELGGTVEWRGIRITTHDLPGHTRFAAAFEFEVDGVRVLATGDQQTGLGVPGVEREILNYQYRNRFRRDDYIDSAALYRRVAPGLMISGHWRGRWVDDAYLTMLEDEGRELAELHSALLPLDGASPDGGMATLEPFFTQLRAGQRARFTVRVRSPLAEASVACVSLVVPDGWAADPAERLLSAPGGGGESWITCTFDVVAGARPARRQRLAADVSFDDRLFGQQAEALVDVVTE